MLTEEYLEGLILKEEYLVMGEKTTICLLKLNNGFEIIGTSAPVDVANFRQDIGIKFARENAFNKLWELEGYLLQNKGHTIK